MYCENCQIKLQDGIKFCSNCGKTVNNLNLSNSSFNNSNLIIQSTINGNVYQSITNYISNNYLNIQNYIGKLLFYQYDINYVCKIFVNNFQTILSNINSLTERVISYNKNKNMQLSDVSLLFNELNQYLLSFDMYVVETFTQFNKHIKDFDSDSGTLIKTYSDEIKYYWNESLTWYDAGKEAIKQIDECRQMISYVLNVFDRLIQSETTAPYATTLPHLKHNLSLLHNSFSQIQYILSRNNQMLKEYLSDI